MPFSFAFIFRAAVLLLLAAHVFYMYCTARGMAETMGFHAGTTIIACLFALVMLLPLVWAVAIPEIPEAFSQHVLPRRRWKQGRCPYCGYDLRGRDDTPSAAAPCPECGKQPVEPEQGDMWRIGAHTVRRFILINLLAWVLGCSAGEGWMLDDERHFRQEVMHRLAAGDATPYSRARSWPNANCALLYQDRAGFSAHD